MLLKTILALGLGAIALAVPAAVPHERVVVSVSLFCFSHEQLQQETLHPLLASNIPHRDLLINAPNRAWKGVTTRQTRRLARPIADASSVVHLEYITRCMDITRTLLVLAT